MIAGFHLEFPILSLVISSVPLEFGLQCNLLLLNQQGIFHGDRNLYAPVENSTFTKDT